MQTRGLLWTPADTRAEAMRSMYAFTSITAVTSHLLHSAHPANNLRAHGRRTLFMVLQHGYSLTQLQGMFRVGGMNGEDSTLSGEVELSLDSVSFGRRYLPMWVIHLIKVEANVLVTLESCHLKGYIPTPLLCLWVKVNVPGYMTDMS